MKELLKVITKLRDPVNGCPWDKEQTHDSLLKNLLEECYELIDAINRKDFANMREELGDVLLQILLHSQIASEANQFSFVDVVNDLTKKLINRHPHVFADKQADNATEALSIWKASKVKEGKTRKEIDYHLVLNPSLTAAINIGKKTNTIGFDWDNIQKVSEVVTSEWQELMTAIDQNTNIAEEIGDTLFSLAQLARHLKIDPEKSLKDANIKFINRFNKMKELIDKNGLDIKSMTQQEMDYYWKQIKDSTI